MNGFLFFSLPLHKIRYLGISLIQSVKTRVCSCFGYKIHHKSVSTNAALVVLGNIRLYCILLMDCIPIFSYYAVVSVCCTQLLINKVTIAATHIKKHTQEKSTSHIPFCWSWFGQTGAEDLPCSWSDSGSNIVRFVISHVFYRQLSYYELVYAPLTDGMWWPVSTNKLSLDEPLINPMPVYFHLVWTFLLYWT